MYIMKSLKSLTILQQIIALSIIFLSIDAIYLSQIAPVFTRMLKTITGGHTMPLNPLATIGTYAILVFGLYYFIISQQRGLIDAFLYGFVIYGVYELTNKATIPGWKWSFVAIDTLWGGILHVLVTYVYRLIMS
jgi:uncharacterized membrane protein